MYFDETLDKLGYSNKPRDIMGNFNIDLHKSESCDNFLNYLLFPEEQLYKTCKEITFINKKKKISFCILVIQWNTNCAKTKVYLVWAKNSTTKPILSPTKIILGRGRAFKQLINIYRLSSFQTSSEKKKNPSEKTNIFNHYFVSVGPKLTHGTPSSTKQI